MLRFVRHLVRPSCLILFYSGFFAHLAGCTAPGRVMIRFTRDELQAKVEKKLPLTKKRRGFTVTVHDAEVSFDARGGVHMWSRLTVRRGKHLVSRGSARVTGKIRYDAARAAFYLGHPKVERLKLAKVPRLGNRLLRAAVNQVLHRFYPTIRLKRLKGQKHRMKRLLLKRVWVEPPHLCVEAGI